MCGSQCVLCCAEHLCCCYEHLMKSQVLCRHGCTKEEGSVFLVTHCLPRSIKLSPRVPPQQAQRSSCVQCSCRVNPSCVMCGGWPTPREDPQYEQPTLERLSRLDLGVHPILSFPDGQFVLLASSLTSRGEDGRGGAAHTGSARGRSAEKCATRVVFL